MTPQQLALVNAMSAANAASSDDGMAAQRQPSAQDYGLTGAIHSPEGLAGLARGLGQKYGPVHEQAARIQFGLDSAETASPEVLQTLADIRAGKYNTVDGPHPLMKLGFMAIMAGGGASALGSLGGAGAGAGISAAEGAGIAEGISSAGAGLGGSASLGGAAAAAGAGGLSAAEGAGIAQGITAAGGGLPPGAAAGGLASAAGLVANGNPIMDLIKAVGPAALGMAGASNQADAYERLSQQYMGMGEPYRQRLAQLYADPNAFLSSPEVTGPIQQAANINARALSTRGNPVGSGNAMQQMNDFTTMKLFSRLGEEKDRLAGFGGLSQYNAAAPGASSNAIQSQGDIYQAAGAGLNNIFNPPKTLAQELMDFRRLSSAMQ